MKKIFRYAMMFAMGALVLVACKKDPKPTPGPGPGPNPDDKEEQKVNPIKITLDGAFSDWDAITEAVAKDNEFVDMKKGASDDPILNFKVSSDADNVYFYIEFAADLLPQNDICSTWGNSYTGTPEKGYQSTDGVNDAFREVMHLFIDPDGDDKTGFYTFADGEGEPLIPGLGCEECAQFFMFYKPSTKLVSVAWEQTCVGPTNVGNVGENDQVDAAGYTGPFDYTATIFQSWPDSGEQAAFPLWGWQNPDNSGKGDNDCPKPENWKPAPAEGNVAKVEFCVEKGDIVNLEDDAEEFACGIIFDWGGSTQYLGVLRVAYSE